MATTDWQRLPFEEQIRYFGEKLNVPTDSYRDISGAEHDAAFVVAGAKGAVLNDLRKAVDRAIAEGTTLEQFRKEFEDVVQRTGWAFRGGSAWRSQVVWETNLRTSYAAGRHEQMQAVATTRPYWQWRHGGSAHPRPQHLALDGKVFRHDDPFWGGFGTPPQGYGCRCSLFTLSDRDLERRGLTVDPGPQLGDRLPIPDLPGQTTAMNPPAGWGHIHGSSTPESRARLLDNVTRRLDPAIAAQVRREAAAFRASRQVPPTIQAELPPLRMDLPEEFEQIFDVRGNSVLLRGYREPYHSAEFLGWQPQPLGLIIKVNDSLAMTDIPTDEGTAIVLAARTRMREQTAQMPDGTLLLSQPYKADGSGGSRIKVYERFGFGPINAEGEQWGIVLEGRVRPITVEQIEELWNGQQP